jgi:hypothetical protein
MLYIESRATQPKVEDNMTKNKIETGWENINPTQAEQYLLLNKTNRPLKPTKITEWAEEMKKGKWQETHQGIAFDWDGNLIDGQNRLTAIIESKTTQRMLVTYNLDPGSFTVIDDGIARSGSDLFAVLYLRKHGERPLNGVSVAATAFAMLRGLSNKTIMKEDSSAYAMKHYKLIQDYMPVARMPEGGSIVASAFCNAALYFGRERIDPLVLRFQTQMWAATTDALKVLHLRLSRARMLKEKRDALQKQDKYALTVSAIRGALAGSTHGKAVATNNDFGSADDKKLRAKLAG